MTSELGFKPKPMDRVCVLTNSSNCIIDEMGAHERRYGEDTRIVGPSCTLPIKPFSVHEHNSRTIWASQLLLGHHSDPYPSRLRVRHCTNSESLCGIQQHIEQKRLPPVFPCTPPQKNAHQYKRKKKPSENLVQKCQSTRTGRTSLLTINLRNVDP
jgi:hypothetical protein